MRPTVLAVLEQCSRDHNIANAEVALEALQVRGDFQVHNLRFIGYDYSAQEWIEYNL